MEAAAVLVDEHVIRYLLQTVHQDLEVVYKLRLRDVLRPLRQQVRVTPLEQRVLEFVLIQEIQDVQDVQPLVRRRLLLDF